MSPKLPVWAYSLPTALLLMAPFDILASLAMDIYLPIVPAMPGILDTSPAIVQLTLSLYMVMLGLGQIVFGPLSDRIGRRPVLISGAILFAAASFCLAASSTAVPFVVLRFLQAVGEPRQRWWPPLQRCATCMLTARKARSSTAC